MNGKRVAGVLGVTALTVGVTTLEVATGRRFSRRLARAVTRTARYQSGRLAGLRYRLAGRHPDPAVDGGVLADRIRSCLGPLEHRLDIPRIHVLVEDHDVLLHGEVASQMQVEALLHAVQEIPGVHQVTSHLHVGLLPGDTRPSTGSEHPAPSGALRTVLAAARHGGAPEGSERACVRSVLSTFAALLPQTERRHVLTHLPADLRGLAAPLRPRWAGHRHPRTRAQFSVAALSNIDPERRDAIVESIVGTVRELVPEESVDVAAVLPQDLRLLWRTAVAH